MLIAALIIVLSLAPKADASYNLGATAYCLNGRMADGSYTRIRSVANNFLPLGTKIKLTGRPGPTGHRIYYVRDRIGFGTALDLWTPSCSQAISWGRRAVTFKVLHR